ncbi:hypothetical protein ACFVHB_23770 [Kitasatospora sp. NPDC127111]|uniref:hypothetical protein n=1 Tax=Kitasatospora sp. NPDC127111 TaxID=3345363 RepID=UPI0036254FE8
MLNTDPVPLPGWLHTLLSPPPRTAAPVVPLSSRAGRRPGYADAALRNEAANVANAAEGTRNWTLTRAARALGRFVADGRLGRAEVEDALKGAAEQAGLPARDAAATITSALDWSIAHNPAGDAA